MIIIILNIYTHFHSSTLFQGVYSPVVPTKI